MAGPAYWIGTWVRVSEGEVRIVDAFRLVLTVVVLLAIALFILAFEKKRAKGIERDLKEMRDAQRRDGEDRTD